MPKVAVVFTGGTIAMRASAAGNVPSLRGDDLLATVPGLEELANVEPIDWGLVPASHLTLAQVLEIGGILRDQLARPDIDGAVVVQGTDVMEETAFAWDLLPLGPKPVAVVGAMRSASQGAYDGPDNLRDAVAVAADRAAVGQGVVVVMAGEIHGADDVRKTHTHAHGTFRSPNVGPLGFVSSGAVRMVRGREPMRLPAWPDHAALPVPVVTTVVDDDGAMHAAAARDPAGLVVAATGGGNTPAASLDAARSLMGRNVPVVLASRCPSGAPRPGYGFPGGSSGWWDAGAIFSGTLDATKARLVLALGVGAGLSVDELAGMFSPYGGGRRTPAP
jgi:L-asparaginase